MAIPKRAMFYWGGGPLNFLRYNTLWSFRQLHPDWEMKLFVGDLQTPLAVQKWEERQDWQGEPFTRDYLPSVRDLNVEIATWTCPVGYPQATPVHCNDLCRWGALSKFGGWFFDMDILFVDRIEALGDEGDKRDSDVAFVPIRDWIPTGFIGAKADNQFTAACYSAALLAPDKARYRAAGSETIARLLGIEGQQGWYRHSRQQFIAAAMRCFPSVKWWMLNHLSAYRWEWFDANKIFGADEQVMPQTVAIHFYGGQRVTQRAMRKLGEADWRAAQNTWATYFRDMVEALAR